MSAKNMKRHNNLPFNIPAVISDETKLGSMNVDGKGECHTYAGEIRLDRHGYDWVKINYKGGIVRDFHIFLLPYLCCGNTSKLL